MKSKSPVNESPELSTTQQDGILRCVLNRPQALNALTPTLLLSLSETVGSAAVDPSIRLITIQGAGDRAFSAGFDIKVLSAFNAEVVREDPMEQAINALVCCAKPTLAVIQGYCLGAGLDLALACDFRLATADAQFAIPAIKLGTVYKPRSIARIQQILGVTVTKELFVTGRQFAGDSAVCAGIVQELVSSKKELASAVQGWSAIPPDGLAAAIAHKRIIDAISASPDRDNNFWTPLEALRDASVSGNARREALDRFVSARGKQQKERGDLK